MCCYMIVVECFQRTQAAVAIMPDDRSSNLMCRKLHDNASMRTSKVCMVLSATAEQHCDMVYYSAMLTAADSLCMPNTLLTPYI